MIKNSPSLRITLIAGIILFFLTAAAFAIFYFANLSGTRIQRMEDNFAKALREYDLYSSYVPDIERDFEKLLKDLDKLEKTAISLESRLSVLKRRRALSKIHPPAYEAYKTSVEKARLDFPMSPYFAALSAEILVKGLAITPEAEESLRSILPSFAGTDYNSILLSLHVLLGDFRTPLRAQTIPGYVLSDGTESVTVNLLLLKILKNGIKSATNDIQSMLINSAPSDEGLRFIAEFFYDYGELERSAEIFTLINDEKALSRASDALYLAGFTGSARNMWLILADRETEARILEKSLYNLGITSQNAQESAAYFESLLNIDTQVVSDFRQFALIRYSRLLELPQAIEALRETSGLSPDGYPFIDLEICKRQFAEWELGRQLAESWLLIDRHPEDEDLYRWACWLFLYQRNFGELKIILNRIGNMKNASWTDSLWSQFHKSLELMYEGDLEEAGNILKNIPAEQADWAVFANLGRIFENQSAHSKAIEQYDLASNKNPPKKAGARLQTRIARCLTALDRTREARLALERALELDPGNMAARMELDRLLY